MASLPMYDCTTPLEDYRLLYSKEYMRLVSSGIGALGEDTDFFSLFWSKPVPPKIGTWELRSDDKGRQYYYNTKTENILSVEEMRKARKVIEANVNGLNGYRDKFGVVRAGPPERGQPEVSRPSPGPRYQSPMVFDAGITWNPNYNPDNPAYGQGKWPDKPKGVRGLFGLDGKTQDIPVTQWGYAGWPPGPKPHPLKWTDPRTGITWTRTVLDGKWLYQSSRDERYYITASNLYELQGLRKDTDGLIVDKPKGVAVEHWWEKEFMGVKAGWLAALGVGAYLLCRKGL